MDSNIRQPLSVSMKAMDILRKRKQKISTNMFKEFIDNPKGIQTSQFKEPFFSLQIQDS